jgi:hypothetical protein
MAQASTPINIQSAAVAGNQTQVTVSWALPANPVPGTGQFAIRFVNRSNPGDIFVPPASPYSTAAANGAYSQSVEVSDATLAGKLPTDYQAEVMALAAAPADASPWGLQIYWVFGFSLSVELGGRTVTLRQLPGAQIYVLPIDPANPPTITYQDLQSFAKTFLGNDFTFPQDWPNGAPIDSSLQLNRFAIDTGNKLLDLDVALNLDWTVFTGFTIKTVGLALQRTNGSPIQG